MELPPHRWTTPLAAPWNTYIRLAQSDPDICVVTQLPIEAPQVSKGVPPVALVVWALEGSPGSLWAPLGALVGRALVGPARPLRTPLGPRGLPWALVRPPAALVRRALVPSWAQPLCAPIGPYGSSPCGPPCGPPHGPDTFWLRGPLLAPVPGLPHWLRP